MDVVKACRDYVDTILNSVQDGKLLLLDKETTEIVSLIFLHSEILQKDVFLVDIIDNKNRSPQKNLRAIVFVRPTSDNVNLLVDELREPKYASYSIYFTNAISDYHIERIAMADEHEVISDLGEYFADFFALNTDIFIVNVPRCYLITSSSNDDVRSTESIFKVQHVQCIWDKTALDRTVDSVCAVLLAMKKNPVVRFENSSTLAKRLAKEIISRISAPEKSMFQMMRSSVESRSETVADNSVTLLILDRRGDLLTPCLMPWTYQAMVHELLTLTAGRVNLSTSPNISPELQEVVLSPIHDDFFAKNLHLSFGELGVTMKEYVQAFQERTQSSRQLDSMDDMRKFIEDYPDFRRLSGNVAKHVAIVSELSRKIETDVLFETSHVEQELSVFPSKMVGSRDKFAKLTQDVSKLLKNTEIPLHSKLRLLFIYMLVVLSGNSSIPLKIPPSVESLVNNMVHVISVEDLEIVKSSLLNLLFVLNSYYQSVQLVHPCCCAWGSSASATGSSSAEQIISDLKKSVMRGLRGVENVYTQHIPPLQRLLQYLIQGKLPTDAYPFFSSASATNAPTSHNIIVYIVGGATYAEAQVVSAMNKTYFPAVKIILGSNEMINSTSFMDSITVNKND